LAHDSFGLSFDCNTDRKWAVSLLAALALLPLMIANSLGQDGFSVRPVIVWKSVSILCTHCV